MPRDTEDRHLQNPIVPGAADDVELKIDEIVIPRQVQKPRHRSAEHFGSSVDVPVRQVEKSPAFEVIEEGAETPPPVRPDLAVGFDDAVVVDVAV
jgi:hypothetical protein